MWGWESVCAAYAVMCGGAFKPVALRGNMTALLMKMGGEHRQLTQITHTEWVGGQRCHHCVKVKALVNVKKHLELHRDFFLSKDFTH